MSRTLENTNEAIAKHLETCEVIDTEFGLQGQGVVFVSEHGRFNVTVRNDKSFNIRLMGQGKYDTGIRYPVMNLDHIILWLANHQSIRNAGKLS